MPGEQEWHVQPVEPEEYIGKRLDRVRFVVGSHPLNSRLEGEINVTVFLYEEEVIGGISFAPDYDGAPYYLDSSY
ncbi:hypothetical protein [Bacillus alkalicellulosilyticus]|uniref:hypothetical protein n=1 Tax=Alkalihalobacterium alkalicellulosilyticum TaxID=1912214 RepID=UPI001FED0142|nr:hypothetical protein [Bacillus alkalicellulosilyticus]